MQISKKQKQFFDVFLYSLNLAQILNILKKEMTLKASDPISKVTDYENHAQINVSEAQFHKTLQHV